MDNGKVERRGGARPGSGPKRTTKQVTINIDLDLIDYVNKFANRNRFINSVIREHKNKEVQN